MPWAGGGREGLTDAGNQFHYYRRTLDDRVLFGGYDANYHFPGRIDPRLEQSASHDLLARHFFEIFPQLEGLRFTHRWAGVIDTTSRFTPGVRHGARRPPVLRRGLHRARASPRPASAPGWRSTSSTAATPR